ncbi:MAG: PA2169 family four-helix-bundle protein [Clostridia bacterium]|nr:PA2169 family four-helix-bundle protein [Clostridia bacterium]
MENLSLNNLNDMLRGEEMAVQAYEHLIQATKDDRIKSELQSIQIRHKNHTTKLAERIQNLGGVPQYSTGIGGLMANIKMNFDNMEKRGDVEILKKAYDGEDQGIALVEDLAKTDIGKDSMALINEILSNDHDHLKRMAKLIGEYEEKQ